MADVKISALPLATTPLAGTEVLPIVQSATTDQVSVANLTAGRAVSAASLTLTTTPLAVGSGGTGLTSLTAGRIPFGAGISGTDPFGNSANLVWDNTNGRLGVGTATPSYTLDIRGPIISTTATTADATIGVVNSIASFYLLQQSDKVKFYTGAGQPFVFTTNNIDRMTLDASGRLGIGKSPSYFVDILGPTVASGTASNTLSVAASSAQTGISTYYNSVRALIQNTNSTSGTMAHVAFATANNNDYAAIIGTCTTHTQGAAVGYLSFATTDGGAAATERVRIDSFGRLLVGTTSSIAADFNIQSATSGSQGTYLSRHTANAAGKYWVFGANSSNAYVVYNQDGVGMYMTDGGTSWTGTSDERLKDITGIISNGVDKVLSLRAVNFTWKSDVENKARVGLVAQDVQKVLPEAVTENAGYLGVAYTDVIPLLTAAIQELAAKVSALEARQ